LTVTSPSAADAAHDGASNDANANGSRRFMMDSVVG
jgi:hypothetical protein